MLSKIIPSRDPNYSFYVECDCGKELIQFLYFCETNTCKEIIALKYYGQACEGADSSIALTQKQIRKMSDNLKFSLSETTYQFAVDEPTRQLKISKDQYGFYHIRKHEGKMYKHIAWEIVLRSYNIKHLIDELDNMYNKIKESRDLIRNRHFTLLEEQGYTKYR